MAETTIIRNALIATMDPEQPPIIEGSLVVTGNQIQQVGTPAEGRYDHDIDATGQLIIPGGINGHHHKFQGYLRGYADIQNQPIGEWINRVCLVTRAMDDDMLRGAALLGMAELIRYGCTTTTDMSYVRFSGKDLLGTSMEAAKDIGMRFEAYTGGIRLSQKDGASFPDDVAQNSELIAAETEEAITVYHDPEPFSMRRVGVGLVGIFTNTPEDFRNAVELRDKYDHVKLQTHVSESDWETNKYSVENFGARPVAVLRDLGWFGNKASYVHCMYVNQDEINVMEEDGTHVVNCPISNARNSVGEIGIAPIYEMLQAGVNVNIGVDGSAGNDSSNLLEEWRWARTVQGARAEGTYLDPYDVLRMGTINGARMLNREGELGMLRPGMAADLAVFDLNKRIENAGTWDPIVALLGTQAVRATHVMINGNLVIKDSEFTTFDEQALLVAVQGHMRTLRERVA